LTTRVLLSVTCWIFPAQRRGGTAEHWNAAIRFDPASPDEAKVEITIDSASIRYDDAFVSGNLHEKDRLDVANYPQIHVLLDRFTPQQDDWLATSTITIRGITCLLAMRFTFDEQDGHARFTGNVEIDSLSFGIGMENDPDGTWLGKTVRIQIQLEADKS